VQEDSFNTWIFTIARNTLIDFFRKRSNNVSLDHCDALIWVDFEEQYAAIVGEDRRIVFKALRQLDDRSRQILSLKYFAELNNREISKLISVNESTVSTLCLRGKKKMKELLVEKVF
jgi:RNA polymerase sigma-70 factor (ECF subfamily)